MGDRMTDQTLKGKRCTAVRRADDRCIWGKNGGMLVEFSCGRTAVVIGRLLRKQEVANLQGQIYRPNIYFKMKMNPEFVRIEVLFNSVEIELVSRWAFHNVPDHFADRPVDTLRKLVKAWWQIYHESHCAGQAVNRTFWERKAGYPAEALDTPALFKTLEEIHQLVDLNTLANYRPVHLSEEAAICLLANMKRYFQ